MHCVSTNFYTTMFLNFFFRKIKNKKAFSLIELIVSISILGIVSTASLSIYKSYQEKSDLFWATQLAVDCMRRAQLNAKTMYYDNPWGVYFTADQITVFLGEDYASRDPSFDEEFDLLGNIELSGQTEFAFQKLTSAPFASGALTLSNRDKSNTITVNPVGLIDY